MRCTAAPCTRRRVPAALPRRLRRSAASRPRPRDAPRARLCRAGRPTPAQPGGRSDRVGAVGLCAVGPHLVRLRRRRTEQKLNFHAVEFGGKLIEKGPKPLALCLHRRLGRARHFLELPSLQSRPLRRRDGQRRTARVPRPRMRRTSRTTDSVRLATPRLITVASSCSSASHSRGGGGGAASPGRLSRSRSTVTENAPRAGCRWCVGGVEVCASSAGSESSSAGSCSTRQAVVRPVCGALPRRARRMRAGRGTH